MAGTLRQVVGSTIYVQIAWAVLAAAWNAAGVALIANGGRALGPTASLPAAVMLLAVASLLSRAVIRWPAVYVVLTIAAGLMGLAAVVNAFRADPALWPSEFWRYAGAALNAVGFAAAVMAVVAFVRWRSSH